MSTLRWIVDFGCSISEYSVRQIQTKNPISRCHVGERKLLRNGSLGVYAIAQRRVELCVRGFFLVKIGSQQTNYFVATKFFGPSDESSVARYIS